MEYDYQQFLAQNLYEFEQGISVLILKDRLTMHASFWAKIGSPDWVFGCSL